LNDFFVGFLVDFGVGNEGFHVFFDDEAIGNGINLLVDEFIPEEGDEEFVLKMEFAHCFLVPGKSY
jgi:hypothetical protein